MSPAARRWAVKKWKYTQATAMAPRKMALSSVLNQTMVIRQPTASTRAMAGSTGRAVMVTGDGSHQLTMNELGEPSRTLKLLTAFLALIMMGFWPVILR